MAEPGTQGQWQWIALEDLGALRVRGADSVRFLQGQLSNDVTRLSPTRSLLAGLHNPQGRTIALLRLVYLQPGDLLAILPRELAGPVAGRLAKYILRAKVSVTDESESWSLRGLIAPPDAVTSPAFPQDVDAQTGYDDSSTLVRWPGPHPRWLLLCPCDPVSGSDDPSLPPPAKPSSSEGRNAWRCLDCAAGLPQVYAATSEAFVAQMLNLDALGAIAFDKGCYTGQEVIARAHYRGRVKRRLQRFVSGAPLQLAPGDTRQLPDGRRVTVVEASQLQDGRCEFLGVAPLTAGSDTEEPGEGGQILAADALALPYPLPDQA